MTFFDDVVTWDSRTDLKNQATRELRLEVADEEILELAKALGRYTYAFSEKDVAESTDEEKVEAEVEVADALADVVWTILGLANHLEIPFNAVWEEVRDSNFSKIKHDGTVERRYDGKIQKPDTYVPPRIREAIEYHRRMGG